MIATLDTNVLISGTLFGGLPGEIVDALVDGRFTLALSPDMLDEFLRVLSRAKFGLATEAIHLLVRDIESHALIVSPKQRHRIVVDDPDDNEVVDCAVAAKADFIVSGDAHLINLQEIENIRVITPAQFLPLIN